MEKIIPLAIEITYKETSAFADKRAQGCQAYSVRYIFATPHFQPYLRIIFLHPLKKLYLRLRQVHHRLTSKMIYHFFSVIRCESYQFFFREMQRLSFICLYALFKFF